MLGTPPAFILSQDQTLLLMVCPVKINSGCLIFPVLLGFVLNSSRTQGRIPSPLFFEFSGSVYCSIFNSQGSVLLSFSATACLVYHAVFDLSTTFFKFFQTFLFCFCLTFRHSKTAIENKKRRKRDLNPRAGCPTYTLSRGASSAS